MARPSFRLNRTGAALAILGLTSALVLSGCTAPTPPPQAIETAPAPIEEAPQASAPPPSDQPAPAQSPLDAIANGRPRVALLVPLTGPNKPVGQAMLDAANMALFDASADIALLPRDTGATPEDAGAAAQKALSDGAGLILGPVFSASVPPVRNAAQPLQIATVTYSTDANVAGGNVFVMGFLPAQQIDRVIGFAKSRGMTKLAALVPDNPYGAAVTAEINRLQPRLGLQPPQILTIGRDPKAQLATLANDPPQMLLLAIGGDQLEAMAPAIGDYIAAHPAQLLGTGLWDDPGLGQYPALSGGWYPAPIPDNFNAFAGRFEATYNYRPPRIATLAYDSVALAAAVSKSAGGVPGPISPSLLLQPNGFIGIDGAFRFLPSGLGERNLAILAVGAPGPTVVDPPPPNFEALGQ